MSGVLGDKKFKDMPLYLKLGVVIFVPSFTL